MIIERKILKKYTGDAAELIVPEGVKKIDEKAFWIDERGYDKKNIKSIDEYSCAMKSHFRKSGNQMSGKWKSSYASLLA